MDTENTETDLLHSKATKATKVREKIVNMKLVQLMTILLLTAGTLAQPASAGPFDALKNFFVRPQPQAHVSHHRPAHPKEAKDAPKDAPNDSPSPVAPPVDQQTNQQPNGAPEQQNTGQQNTLSTNNRQGRPAIAAAPLF
ncbi:MAG: hypothetical protein JO077_22935 [Verrucomicrobia bacterium]|nr:hypothetical protein [Verrucomicrobiota bacterium]